VTALSRRDLARLVCLLAIVILTVAMMVRDPVPAATRAATPAPAETAEPRPVRTPEPTIAPLTDRDRAVKKLKQISRTAHVAVSLRDEESGATFDHGTGRFATASLVKVHLVALMSWRAEQNGDGLTAAQRFDAEQMLVSSENDPALQAYFALGGPAGIEQGLTDAFGSAGIRIGDQGFWGHSTTTPRAVVRLLDRVLDPRTSRTYAVLQDAMSRVVPRQRWGVSALADRGSRVQLKVGWVQDPGGWIVNSSGRVIVDGSPVLISVMTDRNATLEAGVDTIEKVARLAGQIVRADRAPTEVRWQDLGERIRDRQAGPPK
jgi:hypothetical protein